MAQRRVDELTQHFGDSIAINAFSIDIFGAVQHKMQQSWQEKGGISAFAKHVHEANNQFFDTPLHPDVWYNTQPNTSASAHMFIKAAQLATDTHASQQFERAIREAFFINGQDISQQSVLLAIAEQQQLPLATIKQSAGISQNK